MALEEVVRTKMGIQGLDKALNGGFPKGNLVLFSGGAGTGKSTFCLQFLFNGATLFGEKGLYISTEQNKTELYKQAAGFNWDLRGLEEKNLLKIAFIDITAGDNFKEKLDSLISEFKPKRLVVDSLTTLTDMLMVSDISENNGFSLIQIAESVNPVPRTEKILSKTILYNLFKEIKKHNLTTLLTTELPEDQKTLSADGVSEFIADGVICLRSMTVGDTSNRNLEIKKMRYTPVEGGIRSYELTTEGVTLV